MKWFEKAFPNAFTMFNRSKAIIKPFELFGLLFDLNYIKAMDCAYQYNANIIYCDDIMKKNLKKFEDSVQQNYDSNAVASDFVKNVSKDETMKMVDKKIRAMGKDFSMKKLKESMKEEGEQKTNLIAKDMLESIIGKRPKVTQKQKENRLKNQLLSKKINEAKESGIDIDLNEIRTRENACIIIEELNESIPMINKLLFDERCQYISDMMLNSNHDKMVAFVNFSLMDGIENFWNKL